MAAYVPKLLWVEMIEDIVYQYLNGADVHLFTNESADITTLTQASLDTLVEATFGGYEAAEGVSFNEAYNTPGETSVTVSANSIQFDHDGSGSPVVQETIYGYWVQVGSTVVFAERFATPVNVTGLNSSVVVNPKFIIKYPGRA